MENQVLMKLWQSAENEAQRTGTPFSLVFDPIGLILFRPAKKEGYESTPINSLAFATTGGDGVHYSLLRLGGEISDLSPVVMTVPMNFGQENLIVGSDIKEFLCLGCQVGYFFLEQLTYNQPETIYWLTHPDEWFEAISQDNGAQDGVNLQKYLLDLLQKELDLKPWEHFEQRLEYLQRQFFSMLEFQSGEIGAA